MARDNDKPKTISWDDPLVCTIVIVAVYVAVRMLWSLFHEQITSFYVHIRFIELWLPHWIGENINIQVVNPLHDWVQSVCNPKGAFGPCRQDFSEVPLGFIKNSSLSFNLFWFLVLVIFCIRMFFKVLATHPMYKFSKTHSLDSFVKESQAKYPHLRLFSKLNLIRKPLDDSLFGMSLTSRQFAYKYRLIKGWKDEMSGNLTPILDREKAIEVFRLQLGKHWVKSTELTHSETILVAIAIPRVAATDPSLDQANFKDAMNTSNALIEWCWGHFSNISPDAVESRNDGWLKPDIDLKYPREVIAKYIGHKEVQKIISQHAYARTVIFSMYLQARKLGVLPPCDMRWLKYYDRSMWYLLQTIGRPAGFVESAGVLSHYLYESMSGGAIVEPQLDKAVNGLDAALNNFQYTQNDKENYEVSKRPLKPES